MSTARAWDLAVDRPIRKLAARAARADGGRVAAYVERLIREDAARRGWDVPAPRPQSAATRIRDFVRARGQEPTRAVEIVAALGLERGIVDAVLSRAAARGQLTTDGAGAYSA